MQMNKQTKLTPSPLFSQFGRRAGSPVFLKRLPFLALAPLVPLLLWTVLSEGIAMAQSSVMSVTGKAYWRPSSSTSWQTLRPGKLPAGAQVKTSRNATIRLVRPNGAFAVVRGGVEQSADNPGKVRKTPKSGGFFSVLRSMLFSSNVRRQAALETAVSGLEPEEDPGKQNDWLMLLKAPPFTPESMEKVLGVASGYSKRPYQNRALALVMRLRSDMRDHPGIQQMVASARESFGTPATFSVEKVGGTLGGPLRSGATIKEGDRLRMNYRSETESFPYVFLMSIGTKGAPGPAMLHPKNPMQVKAVTPREELFLPGPGISFKATDNIGQEIVWVWSCAAPVTDLKMLQNSIVKVTAALKGGKFPDEAFLRENSPGFCPQTFTYVLHHR